MKSYLPLRHSFQFIAINRNHIIHEPLSYCSTRRVRERLRTMKNVGDLVSFHFQILCGVGVSAPRNKYNKRDHHSVKQAEGVENDCRDLMVLLQDLRRILPSHQVKAREGNCGGSHGDDKK